jgi:hypothetical protein
MGIPFCSLSFLDDLNGVVHRYADWTLVFLKLCQNLRGLGVVNVEMDVERLNNFL